MSSLGAGVAPLAALPWARAVLSAPQFNDVREQKFRTLRQQFLQWEQENEDDRLKSLADARSSFDQSL